MTATRPLPGRGGIQARSMPQCPTGVTLVRVPLPSSKRICCYPWGWRGGEGSWGAGITGSGLAGWEHRGPFEADKQPLTESHVCIWKDTIYLSENIFVSFRPVGCE